MFKDRSSSSGSGASTTKGDEVGIVSRFLAPLCARDETARNIALAAARTTVEGWLGEMASPNQTDEQSEVDKKSRDEATNKLGRSSDARYSMIARSSSKSVPKKSGDHQYYLNDQQHYNKTRLYNSYKNHNYNLNMMDNFETDDLFPQSVIMPLRNNSLDSSCDKLKLKNYTSSFDCVDGRNINEFNANTNNSSSTSSSYSNNIILNERKQRHSGGEIIIDKLSRSISSDEGKGFRIDCNLRFKDIDTKFSSSSESERKIFSCSSSEKLNDTYYNNTNRIGKIKGARPKQLENDDLDSDTRVYGKSPKFDDNMGNFGYFETTYRNYLSRSEHTTTTIPTITPSSTCASFVTIDQESSECKLSQVVNDDTTLEDDLPPPTSELLKKSYEGVVFNTLDGFDNDSMSTAATICDIDDLDNNFKQTTSMNKKYDLLTNDYYYHLQNIDDRKLNAGQIKRPFSQDESISSLKSDRVLLEEPEVTLGDVGRMLNLGNALDGPRQQTQPNKYLSLVLLHLPVILRLSVNCPFQNVRIKCAEILEMVKDRGLAVPEPAFDGPSAFVPNSQLPNLDSLDDKTHMLLMDAFLQSNRLDHVSRVMSSHPKYLEHFLKTQNFILRGDGPLPYDYRHLIAIMAAGRHQCSYIINLQKGEFLLQGGNSTWLQGLRSIPNKLQNLYEINKILAHRPWLLNKTHIEKLTKGADSWSLAEVVHAIVLLAHFHSLSSFVFSCGINEELDNPAGHYYKENIQDNSNIVQPAKDKLISSPKKIPNSGGKTDNNPSPPLSPSIVGEQEVGVETLMERMKRLSEKSESYQITQEELSKRFETVETQSAELAAAPQRSSFVLDSDIGLFIEDPTFIYQDFAKRGQLKDIPTFRVQDYSWDDHGYSLVNRLYNDVGNLLDDKFKTAYNLTYYTMGTHNKVDTSRFRRAIWNYIQCMFGIRHDDYDYNEVNQLLERSLKTFIKSAVCYPERVTKRDYDRVMREFKHSEKVHVNLMILEARMQAELLYALRAVMRYMT